MGQSNGKSRKVTKTKQLSDIKDNGLVFQGKRIPQELLLTILDYVDCKSLSACKSVCQKWRELIENCILRRKVEKIYSCPPADVDEEVLWRVFSAIWDKSIPFGSNLIKHNKLRHIWSDRTISLGSWNFGDKYFINEYSTHYMVVDDIVWKHQDIYLKEMFPQYILDNVKPTVIKIWDWYFCDKNNFFSRYDCKIEIKKVKEVVKGNKIVLEDEIIDSYNFSKTFENSYDLGCWQKLKYEFISYESVDKISFYHEGKNNVQVGGTTLVLEFPCKRKQKRYLEAMRRT